MTKKDIDEQLVTALSTGMPVTAAASACGVSRSTAHRRLADEGFQVRLAQARAEVAERILGRFTSLMESVVGVIERALGDDAPVRVQLSAAKLLLDVRAGLAESVDRDRRLARIERQLGIDGETKRLK
jgi:hypothetical protein